MNRQQYESIVTILRDTASENRVTEINQILSVDLNDQAQAIKLKEEIAGRETMVVTNQVGGEVSVSFCGVEVQGPNFALAFISTLLHVIANRALDKFLPQEEPEEAAGSRREASGSPTSSRALPIGNGRMY